MDRLLRMCIVVMGLLLSAGSASAGEVKPKILFDQGHGQRFLIGEKGELQLSELADVMRSHGADVASTEKRLNDETLNGVTSLVISGPFEALGIEEIDAVVRFIEKGGRLAAMLHIGPPLAGLLARLDLDHSNAVLHERTNVIDSDINFLVSDLADFPLFSGLKQFSVYGSWALDSGKSGTSLARTSADAWADLDGDRVISSGDVSGVFTVAASGRLGSGSFTVFGDDALFQNRYLDKNNRRLAANLAEWLASR